MSEHPAPAARRDVTEYDLLFDCVHCGLCAEACPTYVATRREMDSPRGRIYLMKALAEGRMELDADAARHLDLCLGCRGCETACPSGVKYGRLIEGTRVFVEREYRRGTFDKFRRAAVSAVFPYPSRLRALLLPVRVMDRLGLRNSVRAALPDAAREWLDLLPRAGAESPMTGWPAPGAISDDAPTVVLHHGCVAQVLADSENINSESLLAAAGYRVVKMASTECCGALDLHAGNGERAREFARANVRALAKLKPDAIVSAASGCSTAIAEYGQILKDDRLAHEAETIASKVKDLSSLLLERPLQFPARFECVVTYHDACHLAHGLGIRESPRALLRSVPGLKLVEMEQSDLCCGSAGSYNLTEPAMARELARRKADNIVATGAQFVVLANPGCEFQIAAELRRRGSQIRVMHLADFLALVMTRPANQTR
jgi:glycolate oxidase iron-sulfur subunit